MFLILPLWCICCKYLFLVSYHFNLKVSCNSQHFSQGFWFVCMFVLDSGRSFSPIISRFTLRAVSHYQLSSDENFCNSKINLLAFRSVQDTHKFLLHFPFNIPNQHQEITQHLSLGWTGSYIFDELALHDTVCLKINHFYGRASNYFKFLV